MVARLLFGLSFLVSPAAAFAAGGIPVPEGSQFTLFALGLLGVLVGRRASVRKPGGEREQD